MSSYIAGMPATISILGILFETSTSSFMVVVVEWAVVCDKVVEVSFVYLSLGSMTIVSLMSWELTLLDASQVTSCES